MKAFNGRRLPAFVRGDVALSALAAALVIGTPSAAWAQDATAPDQTAADPEGPNQIQSSDEMAVERSAADQGVPEDAIVVTGTLLRGAPPVGSNLISLGEDRIQSQGATSTNELLATVPQVSNFFNTVPNQGLAGATNAINAQTPNLRRLSRADSASQATLVLLDGHRIAGVGYNQNIVDPDLIPPSAIERVEVVTDGGSSTYGADAVAGVINFITRKRFDGVKVDARYGFADDYWTFDANAIVGKDWGSGSVYATYSYKKNDELFGRDRDFVRRLDYSVNPPRPASTNCAVPNITIGSGATAVIYPGPTFAPGAANRCDASDNAVIFPEVERHGVLAGLHQDLADWLTVDLRAFYSQRKTSSPSEFATSQVVPGTNVFFSVPPGVTPRPASETVAFSTFPAIGGIPNDTKLQEWGANAEFRADLTDNFQLRTLFNYSRSNSSVFIAAANPALLSAALAGATAATAINPFDITATNPDLLANIVNFGIQGQGRESLFDARAIVDGTLFSLPGGDVKLAVGYEYIHSGFDRREINAVRDAIDARPFAKYARKVHSLFGETQIPIIGADNRIGGIYSLLISGSVRYDHYSDFGSTTNPKIGATYKPVSWLGIRGNWGTSFNAPAPVDQLRAGAPGLQAVPQLAAFVRPGDVIPGGQFGVATVAITGSTAPLQPQTADTWSVGIDLDPPFLEGLRASLSYYNVKFENILATPTPGPGIFANFPLNAMTRLPTAPGVGGFTPAEVRAFIAPFAGIDPANALAVEQLISTGRPIYLLVDFRTGNYGNRKVEGLDFNVSYRRSTGFGGIDASVSGDYALSRKSAPSAGAATIDELTGLQNGVRIQDDTNRLLLQATLGAAVGAFRAQATLNHSSGFDILPIATDVAPQQTRVKAYDTVNLFLKYDVPGDSMLLRDLSLTLNVNNVFDQDPPVLRRSGGDGYANGFTIGRLFMFGVSKKF